jgi:hypothetical protein
MTRVEQIYPPLWEALQIAGQTPDAANLANLWQEVEAAIVDLEYTGKLQVSAEAIVQITDIFAAKSQLAFEELVAGASLDGPTMSEDAFDRYVRQSMQIDFERYIEPLSALPRLPAVVSSASEGQSLVLEVSQEELLQVIEESSEPLDASEMHQQAVNLAHDEDVAEWGNTISQCLAKSQCLTKQPRSAIPLVKLQQNTQMPLVQLWLALLLNEFPLEQRGLFYQTEQVWVSKR